MAAVNATDPWFDQLADLNMPVLIVHGDEDPLFPLLSGERLLEAIPGSKLMIIKGLGHAFPPEIWDRVIDWFVGMV